MPFANEKDKSKVSKTQKQKKLIESSSQNIGTIATTQQKGHCKPILKIAQSRP
jgi:hypothetical protein